jgi:hypothetical protein
MARGLKAAVIWPCVWTMDVACRRNDGGLLLVVRWIAAGICVIAGCSARAEPVALGDEALRSAIVGKTVHINTPFGVAIPITYHGNGLMSGKAGVLEYFLGAEADRGRWWIAGGRLCQKWFKWLDAQPSCMRLARDGDRIFWRRDDGLSGTATIAAALAPGADAPPHGLGGPVRTEDHEGSPSTVDPPELVAAAALMNGELEAATQHGERRQDAREVAEGQWHSLADGRLETGLAPTIGKDDRWCHGDLAAENSLALPDLVTVVRLAYARGEQPSPASACFAAEPVLQYLATLGIELR